MTEKIWDLKPDGGGPPVQVEVGNPTEAILAQPGRYTRLPPDGSAQAELAKVRASKSEARAVIEKEKNDKLAEIAKERQAKLDAFDKEEADARTAALEAQRREADEKLKKSGVVPDRAGARAAIEAEGHAAAELAQHEADMKVAALESGAPYEASRASAVERHDDPIYQPGQRGGTYPATDAERQRRATDAAENDRLSRK